MSYDKDKRDVEYIRETSDKALDLMSIYNVVPSPSNYHIWYNYTSGENMSLNKAIDSMIRKNKSFTSTICNNLYERYFSNDQEHNAITHAGKGIQAELTRIAKTVNDIDKGTARYGATLSENLNNMDNIPGGAELKAIISSLMTETRDIASNNNSAQEQLRESAKTVQKLQTTLEVVRRESLTDMLTNIGNRKAFEESLKYAIDKADKGNHELCLVMGDIDHFKKFNDSWGHHVGDQVLKAVAHSIKTQVGEKGTTARYGGEEFIVILPGKSLEMAYELTESIRTTIAGRTMKRKRTGENIGRITCSFGVAKYHIHEHRNDFLERADAALYQSKANGRNKTTLENNIDTNVIKIA